MMGVTQQTVGSWHGLDDKAYAREGDCSVEAVTSITKCQTAMDDSLAALAAAQSTVDGGQFLFARSPCPRRHIVGLNQPQPL